MASHMSTVQQTTCRSHWETCVGYLASCSRLMFPFARWRHFISTNKLMKVVLVEKLWWRRCRCDCPEKNDDVTDNFKWCEAQQISPLVDLAVLLSWSILGTRMWSIERWSWTTPSLSCSACFMLVVRWQHYCIYWLSVVVSRFSWSGF